MAIISMTRRYAMADDGSGHWVRVWRLFGIPVLSIEE